MQSPGCNSALTQGVPRGEVFWAGLRRTQSKEVFGASAHDVFPGVAPECPDCAGGRRDICTWKDSLFIYFLGQMAELCDPWSLFQPHAVRKQLFRKRLWFILI